MGLATETVEGESEWGVIGPIGHKGPINYREPNLSALAFTKSNMPTLQYRERSDRMAQSTLRLNSDGWFVECATAALRSRYCTARSTLTKIRVFVQSRLLLSLQSQWQQWTGSCAFKKPTRTYLQSMLPGRQA